MRRCKGFTLIELLVVIAIIALLLSIMMPALQKARAQAMSIVCLSKTKQISLAMTLYAHDNKQKGVWALYGPNMNYVRGIELLDKYLSMKDKDRLSMERSVWVCPSAFNLHRTHARRQVLRGTNYGWNSNAVPWYDTARGAYPDFEINLSKLRQPSQCMFMGDSHWVEPGWCWLEQIDSLIYPPPYNSVQPDMVHNGGANFAFFDGHAEHRKKSKIPLGCKPAEGDWYTTGMNAKKDSFWYPYGSR